MTKFYYSFLIFETSGGEPARIRKETNMPCPSPLHTDVHIWVDSDGVDTGVDLNLIVTGHRHQSQLQDDDVQEFSEFYNLLGYTENEPEFVPEIGTNAIAVDDLDSYVQMLLCEGWEEY